MTISKSLAKTACLDPIGTNSDIYAKFLEIDD